MNVRHILFTTILLFSVSPIYGGYLAFGSYFDVWYASVFQVGNDGTVTIKEQIPVYYDSWWVLSSPKGDLVFFGWASVRGSNVFKIDKNRSITKLNDIETAAYNAGISMTPDCKFVIMHSVYELGMGGYLKSYLIQNNNIYYTGHSLWIDPAGDLIPGEIWVSRFNNIAVANCAHHLVAVLSITSDGEIIDTGQRFDTLPNWANYGNALSNDGKTYIINGDYISNFRIEEDGAVVGPLQHLPGINLNPEEPAITPDGKLVLQIYCDSGGNTLEVFRIDDDSYLTATGFELGGFSLPQEIAITPDGNFALVMYPLPGGGQVKLAAVTIGHDGRVQTVNETVIDGFLSDLQFIPPQVLFEFGVGEEWEDFAGWSTFDAAPQFTAPIFERLSSGTLALAAPDNTNTFGSWQGPVDAGMVVPYSLYRLRYELKAWENRLGRLNRLSQFGQLDQLNKQSNRLTDNRLTMPSLRLRSNAQTFQQGDTLVIPSIGNAEFSPEPGEWTKYDMYFLAPISSCSRPEAQDDVFCSLDIINMDGDDDIGTTIELKQVFMDRIPVDCITTKTLLHEYHFTSGQQRWTNYSLPSQFDAPNFSWQSGRLIMQASSTNCYGSWDSNPADTLASSAAEVYRATFEVSTDEPDRTKVPDLRFRLSLVDFSLNACQFIGSYSDSEMSPFYDAAHPNNTFKYELYFYKPSSPTPHQLRLSVDLINLSADNTPNATIYIHNVKLEKLELPPFPEDDYFR